MSGWREIAEAKADRMAYGPLELILTRRVLPAVHQEVVLDVDQAEVHIVAIGSVVSVGECVTIPLLAQRRLHPNDDGDEEAAP